MAKWVKNDSGGDKTWVGQLVSDQAYYEIQSSEELAWMNDSTLITDIGSGDAVVAKDDSGNEDIIDVNVSATTVTFVAIDEYSLNFNIDELLSKDSPILAYKMDGQYLESKEDGGTGYLRLILPPESDQDYNGPLCLKWIVEIIFT